MTTELELRVEHQINAMAPVFGLNFMEHLTFPKPRVSVTDNLAFRHAAEYNTQDNAISFKGQFVNDELVVTEEVSHYLHHHINPLNSNGNYLDYFRLAAARETVGRYATLVYFRLYEKLPPPNGELCRDLSSISGVLDHFSHVYGYERAYGIMDEFGDELLPVLSRLSVGGIDCFSYGEKIADFYRRQVETRFESRHP